MNKLILAIALTSIALLAAGQAAADPPDCDGQKIPICHDPPGNPGNVQSICVAEASWPAHEAHGDSRGFCTPELTEITCGASTALGQGTVEMEVVAKGWKMTGPHLVSADGPVTLDPHECTAVEDEKWSCRWRCTGQPGFDGPQSLRVRFDQIDGNSVECAVAAVQGLPVELVGFSVE
jgi:hypothetical protein